ncbi:MAG TPA: succinate dehydrogenase/fumarate reductase iron-sulfur subunit [Aquifex aeolicus]|nr:succinate dehydrogenase/fumarate reductase iron-sulfur subunit [Aquifex aeolicus]
MKVKIKKFRDGKFLWEEYEIDGEGHTVLEILQKIKEKEDPTLSFRAMCRAGICGTCAVKVNGQHKLACSTRVYSDITLEPVDIAPPIKDLVVDHSFIYKKLKEGKVWFETLSKNISLKPDELKNTEKSWDCILCGICNYVCPAIQEDESFGLPSTFTKSYGVIFDKRNTKGYEKLKDLVPLSIQSCTHCKNCTFSCPKECNPEFLINILENTMVRYGLIRKKEQDFGFLGF